MDTKQNNSTMNQSVIIDTPEGIAFFRMAQLKARLKMEIFGLKGHGISAYSLIKANYGLQGSRKSVLRQIEQMVQAAIDEKTGK